MFTGIVEEIGRVHSVGGGRLEIVASKTMEGTAIGDSIAVNGVCLTVTAFTRDGFTADMMPVTLEHTGLGTLRPDDGVNLERALTLTSRLGGHIISGHIDGVGHVKSIEKKGNARILRIEASLKLLRYIVPQGAVALDGVSLTVAQVDEKGFSVSLIPHTREATALDGKQTGDAVNIENDVIGKYVEKLLRMPAEADSAPSGGLTMELLKQYGF